MIRFGTGGWRARIGEDFTRENVYRVGLGVARLLKERKLTDTPVMIGHDRRFLSNEAAKWLAEVLCNEGISVWMVGRSTPTPLIMHTVLKQKLHCGLQVTASHNPPEYNGIKLIVDEGRDAPVETTKRLEEIIAAIDGPVTGMHMAEAREKKLVTTLRNPFNDFLDDVLARIDVDKIRDRGPRILFDPLYGSGTYALLVILCTARCTVDMIHINKDAYFGGSMPAPSESTLADLRNGVVSGEYDLGIGLDGDGDRLGIIDGNGRYMTANEILCMLYYYLHEFKGWKGCVVRNNSTTHMLDRITESFGEKCWEVPVGFKWISGKIDETDAVLGGESSGGLTVRGHIHGKDSAYAAALFVEMISAMNMSPSRIMDMLTEKYGTFRMREKNTLIEAGEKERLRGLLFEKKLLPDFGGRQIDRVGYEDGCKVYFADGSFVVCRFSGTEPLIRLCAEADTDEKAQELIGIFDAFVTSL